MALATTITDMINAVNRLMGVIDGKLRNKANSADVYPRTYLDDPLKTLGANAATADKLKVARAISLSGDAEASGTFDGSAALALLVSIPALADKADKTATLTPEQIDARIQDVIGAAPETLDTLHEIADALGNDPNFAGTMTTELGKKANKVDIYTKTEADAAFLGKTATASNASSLGGNAASHYATAAGLTALETEVGDALAQLAEAFNNGAALINGTTGA